MTPRKATKATKREPTRRVPPNQIDPYLTSSEATTQKEEPRKMGRTADFSGVGDYQPISGGQYELEFTEYKWLDPKTPKEFKGPEYGEDEGKPFQYANCKWVVRDEVDEAGERVAGKVIFGTYSENPKSLWALKSDAVSLGEDPELFGGKVDLDLILGNMVGRSGLATVVVDKYKKPDGTVRESNKIQKIEAIEQPTSLSASRR